MILKLIALGVKKYVKIAWNLFDGVIVIVSIVDLTLEEFATDGGGGGGLSVLRTFRLVSIGLMESLNYNTNCVIIWCYYVTYYTIPFDFILFHFILFNSIPSYLI